MRKAILIAFTGFYLALSLGFSLNLHYCGGKLAKVRVAMTVPKCCCDVKGDQGCCSDASLTIQMDVDQQLTYPPVWELGIPMITVPDGIFSAENANFFPNTFVPYYANPPPLSSQNTRVRMGSLTFYG